MIKQWEKSAKRKFYLITALVLVLIISGGTYAYTYVTGVGTIGVIEPTGEFATCNATVSQPDWSSVLETDNGTETLRPNAPGTSTQCDPVGTSPNYACVDEVTPDDDSTYVETLYGATEVDTYNVPDHSEGTGNITSVTVYVRTRATTTASVHASETVIRTHSTNYYDTYTLLPLTYTVLSRTYINNPNTLSAWTWDEIDALEIGVRQTDNNGGGIRTTQVYVEVNYAIFQTCGEVPTGDLFNVNINAAYSGDLQLGVHLTNTGELIKAYDYLNMELYMASATSANETPNYRLLTLQNGQTSFSLENFGGLISDNWTQTSKADFEGGTLNQVDTTTSAGNVLLDTFTDNVTDNFTDESKIASSVNVTVSNNQVKLDVSGTPQTETSRPNAVGDDTNIASQYPDSGAHWDKVDEVTPDNWSTYVETGAIAIAYEASTEGYSATGQSSLAFNHNVQNPSGNNRLLVVSVSWEDAQATANVSSITFDGQAMTYISSVVVGTGYSEYIGLWYLLDADLPATTGNAQLSVTVSETITQNIYAVVMEYSGVNQAAPDDYDTDANTSGGATSITITAAADGSVAVAGVGSGGTTDPAGNENNVTTRQSQVITSAASGGGDHLDVAAGNISFGWNNLSTREGMAGAIWQPVPSAASWYNEDWLYRKAITIDYTQVDANLSDFPVLISLSSDTDLADDAQDDGGDILFTSSNGTGKLSHEINEFNGATGNLISWVKVPSLSASANTTLYMYYGNATIGDQQDAENVWDSDYIMVQHMEGASYTALDDSTSNDCDVDVEDGNPTYEATGQIDYGVTFDGNDGVEITDPGTSPLDLDTAVTIEAWINPSSISSWNRIAAKSHTGNSSPWTMYGLLFDSATHLRAEIADGGAQYGHNGVTTVSTGSWQHAVMSYDGSTIRVYYNGSEEGTGTGHSGGLDTNNQVFSIGKSGFDADYFTGTIDEVRVSQIARDAGWLSTGYNNQSDPANFYDLGAEETTPVLYARDLYNIPDHSTGSGAIDSVTVYFRFARDSGTGSVYARAAIKTYSTVDTGTTESTDNNTFILKSHPWTTNPDTGQAWTWDEIDALQAGIELRGDDTTDIAACTQVYVEVNYTPYNSPGELTSINLLSGEGVISIVSFGYNASAIPSGTGLRVQFSQDNSNWYNSANTSDGWDTLSQGTDNVSLTGLSWSGANFYYHMEFTSDGNETPVLDEISVNFSSYYLSGDLTSSAYDAGSAAIWDWLNNLFTIVEPASTDIKFQIRTATTQSGLSSATWYGPTGTGDFYTTSGTAVNPVHDGERWIQYKAYFSGPGDNTPTLSDVTITYNSSSISYTVEVIGGSYCFVSDDTSGWGSGWTLTPEFYCEATQR